MSRVSTQELEHRMNQLDFRMAESVDAVLSAAQQVYASDNLYCKNDLDTTKARAEAAQRGTFALFAALVDLVFTAGRLHATADALHFVRGYCPEPEPGTGEVQS